MYKPKERTQLEVRIDEVTIEIGENEEVKNLEKEFHSNWEFIRSFVPDSYWNNWAALEYAMNGIRIIEAEKAYRAGLFDGIQSQQQVNATTRLTKEVVAI